ncbi:hypothetical protein NCLIV_035220 [Neospora caninum Liverpool]|uniref:Uncharacterized protein n=1 Tax=Neospora caninum (strain Liverpool) TaxID=572307 RepID=F0VJ29_NEOCL|nr:hypothetical protein NCLIV_035220 [Neospora caninum Liverpool]CBZ53740.1 hypothetical protein NCLIV_035220 [Neospora caninum Liverpool]|eukprot:XP_003883772.1 hypothetical protein NCLIV_035220 [Neospora caninum Liverpool]
MAQPQLPVYSIFTINTPSMSVTISSDDTPLPAELGDVKRPASLVTVNQSIDPGADTASTIPAAEPVVEEAWAVVEKEEPERAEPHDFTYWDKLRRRHTKTEIRRWTSFFQETQQDTAFYGRNIEVDVPAAAYSQGVYFQRQPDTVDVKEFKLPTESYVAPPVWIRRTRGTCNGLFRCGPCGDSRAL